MTDKPKALTVEQVEDLRNEICAENGWMPEAIEEFHTPSATSPFSPYLPRRRTPRPLP